MSIQHVGAVLHEMPELRDQTAAFVLAAIADSADRRTGWTFDFAMADIASAARLTPRRTRDRIRLLERAGYIKTRLKGRAGRERLQFRVLFTVTGDRRPELELYPPALKSGVPRTPPAPRSSPPDLKSPAPDLKDTPLNNPLIGDPSLSVSIRKDVQKHVRPKTKRIPEPSESESQRRDRLEESRRRQLAELAARA